MIWILTLLDSQVSYRYCSSCATYVLKKHYKEHLKTCETCELKGTLANNVEDEEEGEEDDDNNLDTSKDDEDDELIIEDEGMEEVEEPETKKSVPNKIYNCFDCNRMFMSSEAHAKHICDVHGGEGGSVVLKLPVDKSLDNKEEYEEKADDELVIDDSQ